MKKMRGVPPPSRRTWMRVASRPTWPIWIAVATLVGASILAVDIDLRTRGALSATLVEKLLPRVDTR